MTSHTLYQLTTPRHLFANAVEALTAACMYVSQQIHALIHWSQTSWLQLLMHAPANTPEYWRR